MTSKLFSAANEQPKPLFGGLLIRSIIAARQRKADREIRRFSSIHHDSYRAEFGLELERRVSGQ
jgi:uncharacterized heparinase superfamily protein